MALDIPDDHHASAPFEGPEKLLEIWFAPSAIDLPDHGLRKVDRAIWEDMLDIVKCKVLSVVQGDEIDAYLLSESSLFVFPHRLILKTCGTTLNLLGLPRILEIAATHAGLPSVYRCFYSRKSFMFPERQLGPHRDWKQEVEYLDNIFDNGAAYTVGKVNGDHWLLYMTNPDPRVTIFPRSAPPATKPSTHVVDVHPDFTIEILMSDLSQDARTPFFSAEEDVITQSPSAHAQELSKKLDISQIFPSHLTTLDAYSFTPCGYSSNALIKWGHDSLFSSRDSPESREISTKPGHSGEGYYTIHVTPEEGWSYASFECNVPLSASPSPKTENSMIPDLQTLVRRVVKIFQPGRLTLTLFISSVDNESQDGDSAVETAQKAFRSALSEPLRPKANDDGTLVYKRTDKINYEFGGYDLAFASFELV